MNHRTDLDSMIDRLSQENQTLIMSENPEELMSEDSFRPIVSFSSSPGTPTSLLSSSPMQPNIGVKRRLDFDSENSAEPRLKRLTVNDNTMWHKEFIQDGENRGYCKENPIFVPKYIAQRLPLPMPILSAIFNNYCNGFDRDVLTGRSVLLDSAHSVHINRQYINGIARAYNNNAFFISIKQRFWDNANDPEYNRTIP